MNIFIAPDSFKGSMTSIEAALAIKKGIEESPVSADIQLSPMADGGEGTVDALVTALNCEKVFHTVSDPLGRPVTSFYAWNEEEKTAIIETAAASGITLLKEDERNPYACSTHGTGGLMKAALDRGAEKIIIGIGGSATVDGGAGFLQALGVQFYDKEGRVIKRVTGDLQEIYSLDMSHLDSRLKAVSVTVASDVSNPLLGKDGAVTVFGPQKGVKEEEIPYFEAGMAKFAQLTGETTGKDFKSSPGAGASGGFGFALLSYLDAPIQNGFDLIADLTAMEEKIAAADLVISGEGKLDKQTFFGKGPMGIAKIAEKYNKPVILFAGSVTGEFLQIDKLNDTLIPVSINNENISLQEAIVNGRALLQNAARQTFKTIYLGKSLPL
ncbi:glycerate kinase [Salipaludibacillus aurantiacus]|uniref:Glycerate kinase n=1 Tax=Salipaludibacillus aurantiacus TaxID=1601833 RepID=A0A1H9SFQ2_9BACI|nr:glycerate kinase [Salipaludibacillus aurantiacus]SER83445.1 glycerate kinase [Salipaludibacillus aurantiacus]